VRQWVTIYYPSPPSPGPTQSPPSNETVSLEPRLSKTSYNEAVRDCSSYWFRGLVEAEGESGLLAPPKPS
jgi:hypothetical protein